MLKTTEKIVEQNWKGAVFKDWSFGTLVGGTPARRYGLLNKALKKGEITHLSRGIYILSQKYHTRPVSKFFIASRMVPSSFVSFESALSFHGWIPEAVRIVMSTISGGRSRTFETALGEFEYIKIPVNQYEFLSGVFREELEGQPFLMASPLRALADYVYLRHIEGAKLDFILDSMRIEMESLESLNSEDFETLLPVYRSKRVLAFLTSLKEALGK